MTQPVSGNSNVTPDPSIHTLPTTARTGVSKAFIKQLEASAEFILEGFIGQVLIAFGGISIAGVKPFAALTVLGQALVQQANDAYVGQATANAKSDGTATVLGMGSGAGAGNAFLGTLNPTAIWANIFTTFLSPLISALGSAASVVLGLFGISGGDQTLLNKLGSNLQSMLGNPNFNIDPASFDPIAAGGQQLQNVLTPAGALSTFTTLPAHLLAELGIGQAATNLLPAGDFPDPSVVSGVSGWTYDATKGHTVNGSIWASGAGILRQMIGVAIGTNPGDVTQMSCWTKWTGVTATTGAAICLCANAYSDAAATTLISDPTNRVLAKIVTPGTSSSGFAADSTNHASAADSSGWVQLTGQYQAPAGTQKVRLVLEVESVVNAGSVGFDDCVQTIQSGILDSSLLKNIENIPQLLTESVAGFSGIADLVTTFQHMIDGLGSAYDPAGAVSGLDFPDLFGLAQAQTTNSITAAFQAALHTVILGNRTNKSAGLGANPTSQGSLTADAYSNNGTLTTLSLTAGNCAGHRFTVPEYATYGFLEIQASGTSVTNIFINIYKIDPVTNAKTALFNSSNIAASIPSTNNHVRTLLPGMPQVNASDELLFEIVNNGSNALTIVYAPTAIPNNANEVIKNTGWTRTVAAGGASPTSLTSGQGSYSGNVAYAVVGIVNVPANYHPPAKDDYTTSGSETMPSWLGNGDYIDVIGCSGGGGGGSSFFYVPGDGGAGGVWGSTRLVVGTDIKLGSTYSWVVGVGGLTGGSSSSGGTGGSTTFTYTDPSNVSHTITVVGGAGGAYGGGGAAAGAAGNITVDGVTYFGGAAVGAGSTGQSPGGGGGGAISYLNGTTGGAGQLSLYRAQH